MQRVIADQSQQQCRVQLVQDLMPGDHLPEYDTYVVGCELITDPYPELARAAILLTNGQTLWLLALDDIAVDDA